MGRSLVIKTGVALTAMALAVGCSKSSTDASVAAPKTLYVASGLCYSGSGITTYTQTTASRVVSKWSTASGLSTGTFTDLNVASNVSVNTVPQSLIDRGDSILMLTENSVTTGDRKIFKIMKNNPGIYITYANDPAAFTPAATNITRSMALDSDGGLIFSKSVAAEKVTSIGARVAKGGVNPWINPAAATGTCFSAVATFISSVGILTPFTNANQGKLVYLHAGATAAVNNIGIVQRSGLTSATAADCAGSTPAGGLSTVAHTNAPNVLGPLTFAATGASPTSMVYIPTPAPAVTSGKLLVTYSSSINTQFDNNTNFNYGVVMWDVTETSDTAATVNNPVILWRDESVVWAPSAITYDASTSSVYVAVGGAISNMNQTTNNYGYNVEKFTLDMVAPSLTRVSINNQPFISGNSQTKCISNLAIGN